MPPELLSSVLLEEWYIVTRKSVKDGITIAHTKYPIPEKTIWQVVYTSLIKKSKTFLSGSYKFEIDDLDDKTVYYEVTVKRLSKKDEKS